MSSQRHRDSRKVSDKTRKSPAALFEAGLRHFQSGRLSVAEERCRQALASDPAHADSLHLLGLIHAQANRLDQAIECVAQAIRSNPDDPDYFSTLGTLLLRQGRFDEALKSYDLALKLKPDSIDVWIGIGDLLRTQRRFDQALLTYDHALALDPAHADAANKAGLLLLELRRFAEALAKFEIFETIKPDQFETSYNIGMCLGGLARWQEATAIFRKAVEIAPQSAAARHELGQALLELQRADEAVAQLRKAIEIEPRFVAALNNLANALVDLKRCDEALSLFDRALSASPETAELFANRANALKALNRFDDALACYDRAIALKPDYVQAYTNRGNCLDDMMRPDEALSSFRQALALQPDSAEAHWNLAVNRLRAGDFATGWIEAEWRWKCPAARLTYRPFEQPVWRGAEPVDGKVLLLHNDQGLGDALQFCRYAPLVAARGARIILEVERPLRGLLSGLSGVSQVVAKGEALPDFDLHCPLMSLPLAFATTLDTIPSTVPYLTVDQNVMDWQARLGPAQRPRIGLVWSGSSTHGNDRNRSIGLEALLPLLQVEAEFISLQKDVRPSDQAVLRDQSDIVNAGSELESFVDTAALVQHLDLLISVDTSVAHLAGALGRPCWLLLPHVPDWRWLLNRNDTPWYPSLRLYRQSATREWRAVVDEVREALQDFVNARSVAAPR